MNQKENQTPGKTARVKEVEQHIDEMNKRYNAEIAACREQSVIYDETYNTMPQGEYTISVEKKDSVTAILEGGPDKQCVLNFASYTNPGGGFLSGSIAQEEALCHESFLYNVISQMEEAFYQENRKDKNSCLYKNRCIYSPDVIFKRGNQTARADVITCASPNWSAARLKGIIKFANDEALRMRIRYILNIISMHKPERIILGAFGCGVFGQNPKRVAKLFHEEIDMVFHNRKAEIVFAIPMGNGNFEAFLKEMNTPLYL